MRGAAAGSALFPDVIPYQVTMYEVVVFVFVLVTNTNQ